MIRFKQSCTMLRRASALAVCLCLAGGFADQAAAQADGSNEEEVLRIGNLSDQPFEYQLRRSTGVTWTDVRTLPAGQYHEYEPLEADEYSALMTLGVKDRPGSLVVRFPQVRGFMRYTLQVGSNYWYHVDDEGVARMFAAADLKQANALLAQLERRADELSIEQLVITLVSNHVIFPKDVVYEFLAEQIGSGR